ncbi:hypothetical protein V6N13_143998 [Hibiscus sabdariffa]
MITGGGDTTMVALTWTLSFLLNNRRWLRKAQEELDVHVGKERLVNESDLSKLECLQAIVKEALRLHPPVLLYPRLCHEDIRTFDVSTVSNATVDMTEDAGLTNTKATPLEVLIKPRLSSKIYK